MKTAFYKIEALTNIHAGSGDANYGVIDNLVQRDVVTELPTVHGSSLKGAIKEFFENQWDKNDNRIKKIFGDSDQIANYRFLSARLLAIPLRSNKKPYFLATAPMVLKQLKEDMDNFKGNLDINSLLNFAPDKDNPIIFINDTNNLLIEDFENFEKKECPQSFEPFKDCKNLVILNDENFKEMTNDLNLPVIARNHLENGQSQNLWYEQVVPSKSLFWFVILYNEDINFKDFEDTLVDEKNIIHIGANATVGYGFTKISKLLKL